MVDLVELQSAKKSAGRELERERERSHWAAAEKLEREGFSWGRLRLEGGEP